MSDAGDALMQIGESTAEAVMGVLQVFCPEEGQVTQGLVAAVPPGVHPMEGVPVPAVATGVSFVDGVHGGNVFVMTVKGARRLAASMMGQPFPQDDTAELTVLELTTLDGFDRTHPGAGLFYAIALRSLDELAPFVVRKDQTMTVSGIDTERLARFVRQVNGRGIDRIVPFGEALTFGRYWDGYDLLAELTRRVYAP